MKPVFVLAGCILLVTACVHHQIPWNRGVETWTIETLDDGSYNPVAKKMGGKTGSLAACAFDSRGNFHAAYSSMGRLRYFFTPQQSALLSTGINRSGLSHTLVSGWRFEIVPITPDERSQKLLMGIDAQGSPQVFYISSQGLERVVLTASGWIPGVITTRIDFVRPWTVAFSSTGRALVAFENPLGEIAILQPGVSNWKEQALVMPKEPAQGKTLCLKASFDSRGIASLAYLKESQGRLTFWLTRRGPKSWAVPRRVFSLTENPIANCQVDFDKKGMAHLAYLAWMRSDWDGRMKLVYGGGLPEKWRSQILLSSLDAVENQALLYLTLSYEGAPRLVYYTSKERGLRYMVRDSQMRWGEILLDSSMEMGNSLTMGVNLRGDPWVLYQDAHAGSLKLARRVSVVP